MKKARIIRLYPNDNQIILLEKTFGCCRYVYNNLLNYANENKEYNRFKLQKVLTELKVNDKTSFLKEPDKFALQNEVKFLSMAFKNYFSKREKKPTFKSKKNSKCSYQTNYTNNNIFVNNGTIKLPKLGLVKCSNNYDGSNDSIINVTISKEKNNKYYASIVYEAKDIKLPKTNENIGIDLGTRKLVTTSDNEIYKLPSKVLELNKKIRKEQRKLSRKENGSSNKEKQRIKLSNIYNKRSNIINNTLHQITYSLVKKYDNIYIEDLDINQLLKIQDRKEKRNKMIVSSLGKLVTLLKYKANMYDKQVHIIDKYYASSKTCSNCNNIYDVKDKEVYRCPCCNLIIDRDYNAAKNILKRGIEIKI